jgi:hypothetical protein
VGKAGTPWRSATWRERQTLAAALAVAHDQELTALQEHDEL